MTIGVWVPVDGDAHVYFQSDSFGAHPDFGFLFWGPGTIGLPAMMVPEMSDEQIVSAMREASERFDGFMEGVREVEMGTRESAAPVVGASGRKTALYLIRVGEMYKIGISQTPDSRAKQIQTGSHLEVELLEVLWLGSGALARQAESLIHKNLAEYRVKGEWFDLKEQPSLERLVEELGERE